MSQVEKLIIKDNGEEYEIYVESKQEFDLPEDEGPRYRAALPTVNLEAVHKQIRGYAKYAIGAFKEFSEAEVEEISLKFGLKVGGSTGIPFVTEGSAEGNFEVTVKCKFPDKQKSI
ncbi:MAG: hypothetical protein F6K41_33815 [Symploca sp. SIO3E6]|nr:hypothetical protein [Caldora sp. SIO3E6]